MCVPRLTLLVVLFSLALSAQAQDPLVVEARLSAIVAPDTSYSSRFFGFSVDMEGTTAAVGAPDFNPSANPTSGSVHVYERDGAEWVERHVLSASTATDDDFGYEVDLHGHLLLVAAPRAGMSGEVYLFEREGVTWNLVTTLTPPEPLVFPARFGESIALGDGVLVVGNGEDAAYVYSEDLSGWNLVQILSPDDTGAIDDYGTALAIDGSRLLVSDPNYDTGSGRAWGIFVYEIENGIWTEADVLTATGLNGFARPGAGLELHGDLAIIGAPRPFGSTGGTTGNVVVFGFDGTSWSETARLVPDDVTNGLGRAIAYDGRYAYVTAFGTETGVIDGGSLHIFDGENGWSETEVIAMSSGNYMPSFWGRSVAVSGDYLFVGSPEDSRDGGGAGAVYAFERTGGVWTEIDEFLRGDQVAGEGVGWSVALNEARALLGAPGGQVSPGVRPGAAYVFDLAGGEWQRSARLLPEDPDDDDEFGTAVTLDGNRAYVTAPRDDEGALSAGAVYVFEYADGVWGQVEKVIPNAEQSARVGLDIVQDGNHLVLLGSSAVYPFRLEGGALVGLPELPGNSASGLALDDFRLLIGDTSVSPHGEVAVYDWNGDSWEQTATFSLSDAGSERIGQHLALDGGRAVAGSNAAAYVFEEDGGVWSQTNRLTVEPAFPMTFPVIYSVALDGGLLVIGAASGNLITTSPPRASGTVTVYEEGDNGWVLRDTYAPYDASSRDQFGRDLAVANNRILVASPISNPGGSAAGVGVLLAVPEPVATVPISMGSRFVSLPVPNPSQGRTSVHVSLPAPGEVRATLVDALGRTVAVLHEGTGSVDLVLDVETENLAPGIYAVVVEVEGDVITRRFTVVR